MCPILFKIGPVAVYSFGLMMAIAFIIASFLLTIECKRKHLNADFSSELSQVLRVLLAIVLVVYAITYLSEYGFAYLLTEFSQGMYTHIAIFIVGVLAIALMPKLFVQPGSTDLATFVVMVSIFAGLIGSKTLSVFEDWSYIVHQPLERVFSPGGLTWYGGFLLVVGIIYFYTRKRRIPFLRVCDAAAPSLLIGYGVARIGCHLAGDGDYGIPTSLPWGTNYANGTYPPSVAFRDFPDIVRKYGVNGVVLDSTPVHPTPIYEFIAALLLFLILWKLRKQGYPDGKLFSWYLIFAGGERFLVEFLRINPRILWDFSEAQLISFILIVVGIIGVQVIQKKSQGQPLERQEQLVSS